MLEMLVESFSGCLYVRACFVKIASVSSAWRLLFTVPRPPTHPQLTDAPTPPPPSATVYMRLAGAKLIGVLSPFKRTWTQFACNGFNFLASPNLPSFFWGFFFFFCLLFLEDRHFISLLCANPPALSAYYSSCDKDQRVWVHVCLCAYVCVLRAQKSVCLQAQMSLGPSTEPLQEKKCIHVYAKTCHHGFIVCALQ